MPTLAQQLKQLEEDQQLDHAVVDPDAIEDGIEGFTTRDAGRDHYLDVGPSKLRGNVSQTLLSDKYGGQRSSRMKIFDDDEDEEDEDGADGYGDEDEEEEDDDDEDEDEEDEEDEGEEEDEEDEGEDEDEDEDEEEEEEDDTPARPSTAANRQPIAGPSKPLDPVGALRASRMKDVEKGRAIKRQRTLFDSLLTLRITLQKALISSSTLPDPISPSTDTSAALASLSSLSQTLFDLRSGLPLLSGPSSRPAPSELDPSDPEYWLDAARDSFQLTDASHPALVSTLSKWSAKIQAATVAVSKGGSKFSSKSGRDVVDAIEAGLASRREAFERQVEEEEDEDEEEEKKVGLVDLEEANYRALLREVIESRQGTVDLGSMRREKKRKREAERGGSKGRKLRYTVHEKASNFVVPIPLAEGWHEDQVDELFSSLFGGAVESELPQSSAASLGGLKVI